MWIRDRSWVLRQKSVRGPAVTVSTSPFCCQAGGSLSHSMSPPRNECRGPLTGKPISPPGLPGRAYLARRVDTNGRFALEWALVLTDDAVATVDPGNAAATVDVGVADNSLLLLIQPERRDRARWAGLAARVATEIPWTAARHQHRRASPRPARTRQARLQPRGRANLQANTAADALRHKLRLARAGRPDEARVVASGRPFRPKEAGRGNGDGRGGNELAARWVIGAPDRQYVAGAPPRRTPDEMLLHTRTDRDTLQAHDTFRRVHLEAVRRIDGARGTGSRAALAVHTGAADRAPQPGKLARQAQQSAQRAQVAAPEAVADRVEGHEPQEQKSRQYAETVERLVGGKERTAQRALEGVHEAAQPGNGIQRLFAPCNQCVERRPGRAGRSAIGQGDRVQKQQARAAQDRHQQNQQQQEILSLAPADRQIAFLGTRPVGRRPIQNGTQRAEPATPDPPQDQADRQHDQTADQQGRYY